MLQFSLPLMPAQAMTQQVGLMLIVVHINRYCVIYDHDACIYMNTMSLSHSLLLQATRHARRVYVGGLPPMANEQVFLRALLFSLCHSEFFG